MYLDLRSVLEHIKFLEADLTNHQSMGEDTYPFQKKKNHNLTHQGTYKNLTPQLCLHLPDTQIL